MVSLLLLTITISCPLLISGKAPMFDDVAGTVRLSISQGAVIGKRIDSYDNRTGYAFLGIPFGAPPVGSLRFANPVPARSWDGVRNATVRGVACPAVGELTYKRPEGGPMSEDCLHVYVYSSKSCLEMGGCAIMWVLHGGRYNSESPVIYDDDVIVHNFASDDQDVVVIVPAYRLENFGFLNIAPGMNTSAVPNTAVWDLLLAMKWTHREAHNFGGDPTKITLFGHSAGAQFADTISVSPHFAGLFQRAVLMSGAFTVHESGAKALITTNSLASWVTARLLNCAEEDTNRKDIDAIEAVIACMRTKTWQEIVEANLLLNNHPEDYTGPHADGPGGIIPLPPSELPHPPMDVMLGTVTAEAHLTKYALDANNTANLFKVTQLCDAFSYGTGYTHPEAMAAKCIEHYMQGKKAMDLQQDTMLFMPNFVTARNLARRGNKVFLYSYMYTGAGEAFKKYNKLDKEDHPSHSEDFMYILGMHRGNFTNKDYEIERIYSGMVLHFIKTGYPYPGVGQSLWKPFRESTSDYYEIDFDGQVRMPGMRRGYQPDAVKMWTDDAEKFGGKIHAPDDFPSHTDQFAPFDMVTSYVSHHMNKSMAHDKTLEVEEANYVRWNEYISNRRVSNVKSLKSYRSAEGIHYVVLENSSDTNYIRNILVICLLAALACLLIRRCLHWDTRQKRKGYDAF